jgi:hypothetical protein
MNIKELDNALIAIVEKKNLLSTLDYNDQNYDRVEEELHDLEDDFIDAYGLYLEEALHLVHDEYCPDNDVLLPIAYMANQYIKTSEKPDGSPEYTVAPNAGVIVDADDYPGKISRLVFVPNPTRLMLNIEKGNIIEVWRAK